MTLTRFAAAAVLLTAALALTGCNPEPAPQPSAPAETPVITPTPTPTEAAPSDGLSADDYANIEASITSDNTAALEQYLADSLLVTIASSEFTEQRTPVEAINDLEYIQPVENWVFPIDQATLDALVASPSSQFMTGVPYGGIGPDNEFIIFGVEGSEITSIFMGLDVTLLLP
jgi:hypothetical protein